MFKLYCHNVSGIMVYDLCCLAYQRFGSHNDQNAQEIVKNDTKNNPELLFKFLPNP
jgi:hypothetical protein